jgi:hypothetical protein
MIDKTPEVPRCIADDPDYYPWAGEYDEEASLESEAQTLHATASHVGVTPVEYCLADIMEQLRTLNHTMAIIATKLQQR